MTIVDFIVMFITLGIWSLITFVVLKLIPTDDEDNNNDS